jgi:hypothetical protein
MPTTRQSIIPPIPIADIGMPPPVPIEQPAAQDLSVRLAWAGALAILIMAAAVETYLLWLIVPLGWAGLIWLLGAALLATLIALGWVARYIRYSWAREAFVAAADRDQVNDRLDYFKAWGETVIKTQEQYNRHFYPARVARPKRLVKLTNGNRVYWVDEDTGTVWKRGTQASEPARVAAQDSAPTNHLPDAPPPTLTRQQQKFLHLILTGRAYGARAVVGVELERSEYNAVTASFTAAGILYKQDGKTFALAPMLTEYRSAWAGANDPYRREIEQRAETWALRLLAHNQQQEA